MNVPLTVIRKTLRDDNVKTVSLLIVIIINSWFCLSPAYLPAQDNEMKMRISTIVLKTKT